MLELSLKADKGVVVVVKTDSVLFTHVYSVELFSEGFVVNVVKIQASYVIFPILRVVVGLHHTSQSLAQNNCVQLAYLMFYFMSELQSASSFL